MSEVIGQEIVFKAARALWFSGVRSWPVEPVPKALNQFTRPVLDAAWAGIVKARVEARRIASGFGGRVDLGDRIAASGVTHWEMAKACGVSSQMVQKWINGSRKPSPSQWATAMRYLDERDALSGRQVS